MKVFILQVLQLKEGHTLEYETIDDVALKMEAEKIDDHEDRLCSILTKTSRKAVEKIFEEFYCKVLKSDVQIFMFDDKNPSLLGIVPDRCELLRTENKTGFNPFYHGN